MTSKDSREGFGGREVLKHGATVLAAAVLLLALGVHRLEGEASRERGTTVTRGGGEVAASEPANALRARVIEAYGKLPLRFEANQGQTDQQVRFLARGPGYNLFLTARGAVLALEEACGRPATLRAARSKADCSRSAVLRVGLVQASGALNPVGIDKLPGASNYFIGNDPKEWHTQIPAYAEVKYGGVYPGIDLVYHGKQGQLEYDFLVAPEADLQAIELSFQGARRLSVNRAGDLVVSLGGGEVIEHAPVAYQEVGGRRQVLASRYVLRGGTRLGFSVAAYDRSKPLVIDPTLVYSTFLGGSIADGGLAIAVDAAGNAYVTGFTESSNFPTTSGAFQTALAGGANAFVSKLNPAGSALVYSTYLGGNDSDEGLGIAIDASGNAYVTGLTFSSNFPTTAGAFQTTMGGIPTAFVSKLNGPGSALVYSTYLGGGCCGGSTFDLGSGIAVDASGNAYVTGFTGRPTFPTTSGAFQTTLAGGSDAFVTKLNPAGSALVYSTFLGGSGGDGGSGIVVDALGNAYVSGFTTSSDFPTASGAFQTTLGGFENAFISKLNAAGAALVYSTYVGGNGADNAVGLAVDASGNAYVTGSTTSSNFPTSSGAFQTALGGSQNAFVSKLNALGSTLVYSTYLGGNNADLGFRIAVDASGHAYVTGFTTSSNFPTTPGTFQTALGGSQNAFVSKLNAAGSALVDSTYLGGNASDGGVGIAVDGSGNAYVTGIAGSSNFPTTLGAFQTTLGGPPNAFVTKLGSKIAFSSFRGKLGLNVDAGSFDLNASFTLGAGGSINPVTQPVTLAIGTYSVAIPAGSFGRNPNGYAFTGVINGVSLQVLIKLGDAPGSYIFLAEGRDANLSAAINPVVVTLSIGNNTGTTQINAEFQ